MVCRCCLLLDPGVFRIFRVRRMKLCLKLGGGLTKVVALAEHTAPFSSSKGPSILARVESDGVKMRT